MTVTSHICCLQWFHPVLIGTSWFSELHCGSLEFPRDQLWPLLTTASPRAGSNGSRIGARSAFYPHSHTNTHSHGPRRATDCSPPYLCPSVCIRLKHGCLSSWMKRNRAAIPRNIIPDRFSFTFN